MKRYISFATSGRFGNAVFEYIATRVIQHYLNCINPEIQYEYKWMYHITYTKYNDVYSDKSHPDVDIHERDFFTVYNIIKSGINPFEQSERGHIYLNGWFQFDTHILENRDLIRSWFSLTNTDHISQSIRVCDLVQVVQLVKEGRKEVPFTEQDVVVHVRLDDFKMNGHDSIIIHSKSYIELFQTIEQKNGETRFVLICDKVKHSFEQEYMKQLLQSEFEIVPVIGNHMFVDFAMMCCAKRLVCSNSTFSWIAMLFGDNTENWFPELQGEFPNQQIERLDRKSQLYKYKFLKW